ncbi:MAG: AAA family ATPase, partial [Planktothrix sp.]
MDKTPLNQPMFNQPYTGKVHPPDDWRDKNGQRVYPYLPSDELIEAVNLAITLQRPLLLQGEPGCGKTKLAQAVTYELGLPYLCWTIKSTSRAQDGLYTYNNLARLRDSQ